MDDTDFAEGDVVEIRNPEHFARGRHGEVVGICRKPSWERRTAGGREQRACVAGDPDNAGESFACVLLPDGMRTTCDLAWLRREEC